MAMDPRGWTSQPIGVSRMTIPLWRLFSRCYNSVILTFPQPDGPIEQVLAPSRAHSPLDLASPLQIRDLSP